jgi:hypothetical protein
MTVPHWKSLSSSVRPVYWQCLSMEIAWLCAWFYTHVSNGCGWKMHKFEWVSTYIWPCSFAYKVYLVGILSQPICSICRQRTLMDLGSPSWLSKGPSCRTMGEDLCLLRSAAPSWSTPTSLRHTSCGAGKCLSLVWSHIALGAKGLRNCVTQAVLVYVWCCY